MDYFTKLKLWAWYESYYQPEKITYREQYDKDFKQKYFNSLVVELKERGKCCISKWDSTTGKQVYFTEDPNKIL